MRNISVLLFFCVPVCTCLDFEICLKVLLSISIDELTILLGNFLEFLFFSCVPIRRKYEKKTKYTTIDK